MALPPLLAIAAVWALVNLLLVCLCVSARQGELTLVDEDPAPLSHRPAAERLSSGEHSGRAAA